MKSLITVFAFVAAASAAFSQSFTIIAPRDGQKVREVVSITFPKDSVRGGSFVGISIDGKFMEAAVPEFDEKAGVMVYKLDTKALGIKDGEHTLGAVRYQNMGGTTMITDRSEVKVVVANRSDIKVPDEGLLLRYQWQRGSSWNYDTRILVDQSAMTEAQNRAGGRAARLPLHEEHARLQYSVEDVKPGATGGRFGLVRTRLLPYKGEGKDYLYVTLGGKTAPEVVHESHFASVYRILSELGSEQFADIPTWHGFFGSSQKGGIDVYAFVPIPVLPDQPQRVGDSWTASIAMPGSSIEKVQQEGKSYTLLKARGVLEGVEYEMGRPCAKIRYSVEAAERTGDSDLLEIAGREFRANERTRVQQLFWLDLDKGFIVRSEMSLTAEVKVDVPATSQGGASGPGGGVGPASSGTANTGGGAGTLGAGGGSPGAAGGRVLQRGQGGTRGGPMQGPGGSGTGGPGGAGSGIGPGVSGPIFIRQTITITMVLEQ